MRQAALCYNPSLGIHAPYFVAAIPWAVARRDIIWLGESIEAGATAKKEGGSVF